MKSTRPDFTAWFVLQGTIAALHQPAFSQTADADTLNLLEILALEAGRTRLLSKLIHHLPFHWQYRIGEWVTSTGRLRHFYLRKQEIEKQTRQRLLFGGIKQVVVLGAGLDVLALRLAKEFPDVNFIEIDRAESQAFKTAALLAHDMSLGDNIELVSGDLRNPLWEILAQAKLHNRGEKTLWIAEGLLMFMPEENVAALFDQLQNNCAPASYCVFTTVGSIGQRAICARMLRKLYLRVEKCPYHWVIDARNVSKFIMRWRYSMVEQVDCARLHRDLGGNWGGVGNDVGDDINVINI